MFKQVQKTHNIIAKSLLLSNPSKIQADTQLTERYVRKMVKKEVLNRLHLSIQARGFSSDDKNDKDVTENTPPAENMAKEEEPNTEQQPQFPP